MKESITIGMDLGDKKYQDCILNSAGKIIAEEEVVAGNRTVLACCCMRCGGQERNTSQNAKSFWRHKK